MMIFVDYLGIWKSIGTSQEFENEEFSSLGGSVIFGGISEYELLVMVDDWETIHEIGQTY